MNWDIVTKDCIHHKNDVAMKNLFDKIVGAWTIDSENKLSKDSESFRNYIKFLISTFIPMDLTSFVKDCEFNNKMKCALLNIDIYSANMVEVLNKITPSNKHSLAYKSPLGETTKEQKYLSKRGLYVLNYFVKYAISSENEILRNDIRYTLTKSKLKSLSQSIMNDKEINKLSKQIVYNTTPTDETIQLGYKLKELLWT
jgi:hypothetical protein